MRIAHVSDCYLPRMGGIERQVHDLATRQQERGDDVTVITSVGEYEPAPSGHSVIRPAERSTSTRIRYERTGAGLRALRAGRFDVVHVHASTFSPLAFAAARQAPALGAGTVFTLHSLLAEATPLFRVAAARLGVTRWPVRWSAVSAVAASSLRNGLGGGIDVAVMPNGVDPVEWQVPAREPRGTAVRMVSVGRLAARKRPAALLDILATVRDLVPDEVPLEAYVIGDGPHRGRLERGLRRRALDWVHLLGPLDRREIRDVHAACDLYLAPATRESFGIAALEARCAGLPVIAHAATGIADFVRDGQDGVLVADDDDMAHAVAALATNPERLAGLQALTRSTGPAITWRTSLAACDALYAEALQAPDRPARGIHRAALTGDPLRP